VGHRCRGAKVDGNIVPLIYELQMGQRIEILTAKHPNPSRDWLNPHHGYLKTARARARVQHWFREQDNIQNAVSGREQITHHLPPAQAEKTEAIEIRPPGESAPDIKILGINNLLTHIAKCCKPLPGDSVVGYVTRNRGLSIHRRDCNNILNIENDSLHRMIEVSWGEKHTGAYPADLLIRVYDRAGILRDITAQLANEKINVLGLQTQKIHDSPEVDIYLTIEIKDRQQLKSAVEQLQKLPNVLEVRRR
jgi:GTP pyrophosphokinase